MRARVVLGAAVLWPGVAAAEGLAVPEAEPQAIFGGIEASQCDFPAAVAMLDRDSGQLFCTGSLIHPSVVVFAAHCMDPV
ncbi:MAG TPA: trypsin-like serine protease, partial [Nannocystis sp.]